jgi:voltage-gated potassium channel
MEYRKLFVSVALLLLTLLTGTIGYFIFEGMSFFEGFYMTVITISTVGFSEIKPLTQQGRVLTVGLIFMGVGIGGYTLSTLFRLIVEGEVRRSFGRRKLEKKILALKNHYIVCGFGRIGRLICRELAMDGIDFVVIENDPAVAAAIEKEKYLYLQVDASSEEALEKAGIMRAKGLVTAVRSDADNVFITLTAKGLCPDIFILSRASDEKNELKLFRAGASRVVSPYLIGGRRMAQVLKRPTVVDFIDTATVESSLGLMMEEVRITAKSTLAGKKIVDSGLRRDFDVIIVAIKKPAGDMVFNPKPGETLGAGDVLVIIGLRDDLIRLREVL